MAKRVIPLGSLLWKLGSITGEVITRCLQTHSFSMQADGALDAGYGPSYLN